MPGPIVDAPIVDAHHHLWTVDGGYSWLDAPELAPIRRTFTPSMLADELAAAGVGHSVLVEGGRCDTGEAALLLAAAAENPRIAGVVAWADPADPGLPSVLADYAALPGGSRLVGIRSQVQGEENDHLDRADVRRGLATIGAAGLSFDLVVRVDQLPAAARVATALPEVRFVLDHLGKPRIRAGASGFEQWRALVDPLAGLPNVSVKLSGLVTEADWSSWTVADLRPYVRHALDAFGADRCMLGSDWPVCLLAGSYGKVREAMLAAAGFDAASAAERARVVGGTANEVYRLGLPGGA